MSLTPTSTIIAGPQVEPNLYDFVYFGVDGAIPNVQNHPALFKNGTDQYCVLYNIPNHAGGVMTSHYTPQLSVRKRSGASWTEEALFAIRNADTNPLLPNVFFTANCFDVVQITTKLYIFYFPYVAAPKLSVRIYDMGTDTLGAEINSALPSDLPNSNLAIDQFSGAPGIGTFPGLTAVYSAVTGLISIIDNNWALLGTDANYWIRPSIANFNPVGNIFDGSWAQMGSDNTVLIPEGAFSACADCRGAVNLVIARMNFAGDGTTTLCFQSRYSNLTVSAVQNTGITASGGAIDSVAETDSRILCTGSEFIIPYGTGTSGAGYRTGVLNARAAVPAGNTLPSAWTSENVHTAVANEGVTAYVAMLVSGQQLIVYVREQEVAPNAGTLSCATWNGAAWADGASPASTVELALANNDGIIALHSLVTVDFTGPVALGNSTNNQYVGTIQSVFSFADFSVPVCPTSSAGLRRGMSILTAKQWATIREKKLRSHMPTDIYLDHEFPNAGFHVWPVPIGTPDIEFYFWAVLTQFATLDSQIQFPPGYYDALVYNLALMMTSAYGTAVPPGLLAAAEEKKRLIQELNSQIISGSYHQSRTLMGPSIGDLKPVAVTPDPNRPPQPGSAPVTTEP